MDLSSLGYNLRQIAEADRLIASFLRLYAQTLDYLRVESPTGPQLRDVIFQSLNRLSDVAFEIREIIWIFCRSGFPSGCLLFFARGLAAFLIETCGSGESPWPRYDRNAVLLVALRRLLCQSVASQG